MSVDLSDISIENVVSVAKDLGGDLASQVLDEVKTRLGDLGVKPTTMTLIIKYTMEAVEKTPVKGKDQMDFALRVIGDLIGELPESEERTFMQQMIGSGGVEETIELVIDASKGNLSINQVAEVAVNNCLTPCFNYISSKICK